MFISVNVKEEHFNFVYAASILRAEQYGLSPILDRARVADFASEMRPSPFEPRTGMKIAVTDEEAKQMEENAGADGLCHLFSLRL